LPNSYKIAYKLKFSSFNWITSNTQENNVNNKFSTLFATLLLSSSLALVGCGSSGDSAPAAPKYTGTTSAAKVDSTMPRLWVQAAVKQHNKAVQRTAESPLSPASAMPALPILKHSHRKSLL
jgi:hypothetical protein